MRVVILKAFEQVGDSKALPVVERLAKRPAYIERLTRLPEAAQACLPILQRRAAEARSNQTLLRATAPSVAAQDTLLRAASGDSEIEPDQLLRASPSEPPQP